MGNILEYPHMGPLESNTVMSDLFEMTPTPSLMQLCKETIKVGKNFQANDDDIKLLIQYGILRPSEVNKVECYKIYDPSEPIMLKIRYVEPRNPGKTMLTSRNLIIASHLCGRDATCMSLYRRRVYQMMNDHPFNNKRFWRLKLLNLEGCSMWFDLFFELYKNCVFDDEDYRNGNVFFNIKKQRRLMIIDMTPRWKKILEGLDFFNNFCYKIYNEKVLLIDELLKCGDVEANPGPVMSRVSRNNNSRDILEHNIQGLFLNEKDSASVAILSKFLQEKLPGIIDQLGNICSSTVQDSTNALVFADNAVKEDINLINIR